MRTSARSSATSVSRPRRRSTSACPASSTGTGDIQAAPDVIDPVMASLQPLLDRRSALRLLVAGGATALLACTSSTSGAATTPSRLRSDGSDEGAALQAEIDRIAQ